MMQTAQSNATATVPFGEWLKRRRKALDLTREKLAWRVGCSFETIKKIELGDLRPSVQLAEMFASKLEVPVLEREAFIQFARSGSEMDLAAFMGLPAAAASPGAAPSHAGLPAPLTSLLGRTRELDAARELMQRADVRLMTLTGPPGAGKTRLALALGAQLKDDYADGAVFVPLALVQDPALVLAAIAQAFQLGEVRNETPATTLQNELRAKFALLVLDNFEQVIAAAPEISALLSAAPHLKIIVTSREPLRVYGEYEFPVPLLELPDVKHLPPVEALAHYAAVELFVARAQAVKPDFELTRANADAVARVCALLDGLPLALEMAAAQVKRNSPARLLGQLEERLVALGGGLRDVSPRQQTLRGAFDWSYNLLAPEEQNFLKRMSVFAGGGDADAVAAVCGDSDAGRAEDLEDVLAGLVDKNLVRMVGEWEQTRYSMLETIRDYAREKLRADGELEPTRRRHALYFLALAEQDGQERETGRPEAPESEHDNFLAALAWTMDEADVTLALRLCGALGSFWLARGYWTEGGHWTERALARIPRATTAEEQRLRARALLNAARLMEHRAPGAETLARYEEALTLWRATGDERAIAETLIAMTTFCYLHGDRENAERYGGEGLNLCEALGYVRGRAVLMNHLGRLAIGRAEHARARVYLQESLTLSRKLEDKSNHALALHNLGIVGIVEGRYGEARANFLEAYELRRELGDAYALRTSYNVLGICAIYAHDFPEARKWLEQSLTAARELHDSLGEALALRNLARLAFEEGDLERARHLNMESIARGEKIGARTAPVRLGREGLAMIALAEGDYAAARKYGAETLEEWHALKDREGIAISGRIVGFVEMAEGDYAGARAHLQGTLEIWQSMHNLTETASARFDLGYLEFKAGDSAAAEKLYREGLEIARGLGDAYRTAFGLMGLAGVVVASGDAEGARRLLGESEEARRGVPFTLMALPKMVREDYEGWERRVGGGGVN